MNSANEIVVYRVFIASPGDVMPERETAYRVVETLNGVLENTGFGARLDALSWEKDTHADAGTPQAVINKQIPIKTCDILIGILWKRFGTPTAEKRPSDGKPYLSGTEEEIETAFALRKKTRRPVIMLYRKNVPIPPKMSQEDNRQYDQVNRFFRECEPKGKHPALVKEFGQSDFETILTRELTLAVTRLMNARTALPAARKSASPGRTPKKATTSKAPKRTAGKSRIGPVPSAGKKLTHPPTTASVVVFSGTQGGMPPSSSSDLDEPGVVEWLKIAKLNANPFRFQFAEDENELPRYFSQFKELESITTNELIQDRKTWIFWGPEGSGKTALRKWLATSKQSGAEVIFLEYDLDTFQQLLADLVEPGQFQARLISTIHEKAERLNKTGNAIPWGPADNLQSSLANLTIALQEAGINRVLCLIDPSTDTFPWKGQALSTAVLFRPILELAQGMTIGFRFFLPKASRDELQKSLPTPVWKKFRDTRIEWTEENIKGLIRRRMIFFSNDLLAPYQSLGELCNGANNLSSIIDAEIASFAEGSPRGALWLANKLIQLHCSRDPKQRLISPESWDKAKMDWWSVTRTTILGIPERDPFWLVNQRIFFRDSEGIKEIALQDRYHRLLSGLVQAGEGFCSKDQLIALGWPGENPTGISEKALSEAVRRMKEELHVRLKAQDWKGPTWTVKSVRGRGYRLQRVSQNGIHQEDSENDTSR